MSPTNVPATAAPNAAASQQQPPQPPTRRVLGDVSPNVRAIASPAVFDHKRIMAGSPLKRTAFSASMEDGVGFTYLKKRKLSDGMPLSQMGSSAALSSAPQPNFVTQNALQMAAGNETLLIPRLEQTVPTEPNTPAGSVHEDDDGLDPAADRRSFSSLINYDPSSQQTVPGSQSGPSLLFKGPSNAELLKLRLRVAMYKVRTNQIDTPLDELHVQGEPPKPSSPTEVEEAVASLRREAQAKMGQRPVGRLLPAPLLHPTAYSSRMVYNVPLPSSPPAALSPGQHPHAHATPHGRRSSVQTEKELTSSIVKGRVAEGLLGLRYAV